LADRASLAELERAVEARKKDDPASYWAEKAAICAVVGDKEGVIHAIKNVYNWNASRQLKVFSMQSLFLSGNYSELADRLLPLATEVDDFESILYLMAAMAMFDMYDRYTDLVVRAKLGEENGVKEAKLMIKEISDRLVKLQVTQDKVRSMLELAQGVAARHGVICGYPASFVPLETGELYVNLPIKGDYELAADLAWEFSVEMFEKMPDAPTDKILLEFTAAPHQ
jgi:hypothetical protein